ncbi:DUF6337 family protein [Virgibacillus salinus]|uniref:Oligosaccharide repeat unit polymerase n=1 Tax=Virgibacillus salinus TaxID=553311 RepID=A0A1H0YI64_9BACI|nr:DUF6337 family protein [Virgibacillus salinus]SDQ14919.1 hypothetical protein SAMN05216231_0670 [Virgibacillus salinus]
MLLVYILIIFILYLLRTNLLNTTIFIVTPFIFIIIINNLIATTFGFFSISDKVIMVIIVFLVVFFTGTLFSDYFLSKIRLPESKLSGVYNINIKNITTYVVTVFVLKLIQIGYFSVTSSSKELVKSGYKDFGLDGIIGHLFLSTYPLLGILLYVGIKQNKKYLIGIVLTGILLAFFSFVKYHVISLVFILYLYISIKDKKYWLKGARISLLIVPFLFILNYAILFLARNAHPDLSFYIYNIWTYIAGSVINMNILVHEGIINDNIGSWFAETFLALPNFIFKNLIGESYKLEEFSIGLQTIGFNMNSGELTSPVVSTVGQLYSFNNLLLFILLVFIWGMILEFLFTKSLQTKGETLKLFVSVFITFSMLSFFSNYYTLMIPWEIMLFSIFIPKLFLYKKNQ